MVLLELSFFFLLCNRARSAGCVGNVFALPLEDVLVDPSIENSYMRGIPASVGTPAQSVVLLPWPELNNTYLYDENTFCDDTVIWSDTMCRVKRGNLYSETDSTSWHQSQDLISAGGALQETDNPSAEAGIGDLIGSSLGGIDKFKLASSGDLDNFPIGVPRLQWDHGYSTLHPLGVGPNSTYLNALYAAGTIGGRVWSLFWGRMWTDSNPLKGSLVIGGYDERLIIGQNYTSRLDYSGNCFTGLKVSVLDITLNFRGGEDIKLLDTELPGCIIPTRQNLLGLPAEYQVHFQNLTETRTIGLSFGLHWGSMLFDADQVYDGDVTIRLSTGQSIRVPNDQFVTPSVSHERNGSRIFNESQKEVLISSLPEQTITLGRYFLTAAYLMVDHEESTFVLWNANPTTASNLKTIVRKDAANTCSNSTTGTNPTLHTTQKQPSSDGLSTGGLVGVIVGVVAAVSALALGAFIVWRRKRQERASPAALPVKNEYSQPYELHGAHSALPAPGFHDRGHPMRGDSKSEHTQLYTAELQDTQPVTSRYELPASNKGVLELAESSLQTSTPLLNEKTA